MVVALVCKEQNYNRKSFPLQVDHEKNDEERYHMRTPGIKSERFSHERVGCCLYQIAKICELENKSSSEGYLGCRTILCKKRERNASDQHRSHVFR